MGGDLHILNNYFPNKREGTVVECGTAEGNYMPSTYLEKDLGWKFIGFEINPIDWNILLKNRPNGLNINSALSDVDGFVEFSVISSLPGNSSIQHNIVHFEELISKKVIIPSDEASFYKLTVPSMTWKSFIKTYNISSVDFLILDVEGCEIKVLNGMQDSDVLPDVIQVEYSYSDPDNKLKNDETRENFSGFVIIKHKLQEMGYDFNYVHFNDAFFSKRTFWKNTAKPSQWLGEDDQFSWNGYIRYNKEKCKNL
jgi:FkbM family methyltransferase